MCSCGDVSGNFWTQKTSFRKEVAASEALWGDEHLHRCSRASGKEGLGTQSLRSPGSLQHHLEEMGSCRSEADIGTSRAQPPARLGGTLLLNGGDSGQWEVPRERLARTGTQQRHCAG